jgi:hypothetical protein
VCRLRNSSVTGPLFSCFLTLAADWSLPCYCETYHAIEQQKNITLSYIYPFRLSSCSWSLCQFSTTCYSLSHLIIFSTRGFDRGNLYALASVGWKCYLVIARKNSCCYIDLLPTYVFFLRRTRFLTCPTPLDRCGS